MKASSESGLWGTWMVVGMTVRAVKAVRTVRAVRAVRMATSETESKDGSGTCPSLPPLPPFPPRGRFRLSLKLLNDRPVLEILHPLRSHLLIVVRQEVGPSSQKRSGVLRE